MRKILSLIPQSMRPKTYGVVLTSIVRALLNFIGLAAVLPILMLVLDPDSLMSNIWVEKVFLYLRFSSINYFIIAICIGVFLVYLVKNILNIISNCIIILPT
jgi:hypothetical protein